MSGKQKLEAQLSAVETLREQPAEAAVPALRAALKQRNNYFVAKAADVVSERRLEELLPDLLAAYDRFFEEAAKSDPQCWAKNSLSRALAVLELQEPEPFLRGIRHVQLEGTWGGSSDTAGQLRGTCALALVQCRTVSEVQLLRTLIEVLADKEKSARSDAVRALAQLGSPNAALLLRLKAVMDGDEAEVLGGCYSAVLDIEGPSALPWAAHFLAEEDDAAGEAALAMASTHTEEAFALLQSRWERTLDPWFRSVLLSAMALTRQSVAIEFLLGLVKADSSQAELAVEALIHAMPSDEVIQRLKALAAGNARLTAAMKHSSSSR
jgi:HEAT repeat protein